MEPASGGLAELTHRQSEKQKSMADMARKNPSFPDLVAPFDDDEGSVIRSRDAQKSSRDDARSVRSHSSSPPAAPGSLDGRIEQKVRLATALMRDLPMSDSRVRLLHIAIMRRDESLLDGVLAELNKPPVSG